MTLSIVYKALFLCGQYLIFPQQLCEVGAIHTAPVFQMRRPRLKEILSLAQGTHQ